MRTISRDLRRRMAAWAPRVVVALLVLVPTAPASAGGPLLGGEIPGLPSVMVLLTDPLIREFAGDYYCGDGLGMNRSLTLKPDGHLSYESSGCLGVYDQFAGTARVQGGFLVVDRAAGTFRMGAKPVELLPVRWGGRHYLIEKGEIADFCNAVNAGQEPRAEARASPTSAPTT